MKVYELLDLTFANSTIYERRNHGWYCVDEILAKNKDVRFITAIDMDEIVIYVEGDNDDNE